MELKLIALSETDGEAVYRMLQEMPAQENGFINPMHGKSYGEFRAWLQSCIADAAQEGLGGGGEGAGKTRLGAGGAGRRLEGAGKHLLAL